MQTQVYIWKNKEEIDFISDSNFDLFENYVTFLSKDLLFIDIGLEFITWKNNID